MAQSRVSKPGDNNIADRAADLGAWDKLQLGWLDYEIVVAGQNKTLDLGPHEYNSNKAQAVVVVLPKKQIVTPAPGAAGGHQVVVERRRRRPRQLADPHRDAARGHVDAELQGGVGHRGLRPRRV